MAKTLIYQFLSRGQSSTVTVPSGYSRQVIAYAWGAGGGNGSGAPGAGGGFVAGIIEVDPDSEITVSVGGTGGSASGYRPAGTAGEGSNEYINLSGGRGGIATDEDSDSGSGGAGGGASAIFVNGVPVIVAAGGGGGGGYGDDRAGGATAGTPGGVATRTGTLPRGADGRDGGGGAGGGGAGYPLGGDGGVAWGDDSRGGEGGFGGQNYANVSVVSDTDIQSGSGTAPGGLILDGNTNLFYPKARRGYQGYDGAVILVFVKNFQAWIKQAGDWKRVSRGWIKTASKLVYRDVIPTPQTRLFSTVGASSFVVPEKVNSITVQASGGGGGGGGSDGGDSNHNLFGRGGSASNLQTTTISVTPGDVINISVGAGGGGAGPGYTAASNGGTTTVSRNDTTVLSVTGGAGGASRSSSAGPFPGEVSSNGGSNGGNGSAAGYRSSGSNGQAGKVILSYTPIPTIEVVRDGGWKEITRAWIKKDGVWKPIETSIQLGPIPAVSNPSATPVVNLVIAANTNNYNLKDYLAGTGYYPGRSVVNLTVNANVIVSSDSAGAPALIVDGLVTGDVVNLTNNGTIQGRGGNGGAAGAYSSVTGGYTSYYCFPAGTQVTTTSGTVDIENIQVGDDVLAFDIGSELNYQTELASKKVTAVHKHAWAGSETNQLITIKHTRGHLTTTKEHEILCSSRQDELSDYPGFVTAGSLVPGDIIYTGSGKELKVISIEAGPTYDYVYNIEVEDYHTYVAEDIRVHNGSPAPTSKGGFGTVRYVSVAGNPGQNGGTAIQAFYQTNVINNGIIAGGGGGGGGGGGPTGGQGGGGAGYGQGANNGTVSAGGAGTGLGGAGGGRGQAGTAGTSSTTAAGAGGLAGLAFLGREFVTIITEGTILGPSKYENTGVLTWSTGAAV